MLYTSYIPLRLASSPGSLIFLGPEPEDKANYTNYVQYWYIITTLCIMIFIRPSSYKDDTGRHKPVTYNTMQAIILYTQL